MWVLREIKSFGLNNLSNNGYSVAFEPMSKLKNINNVSL